MFGKKKDTSVQVMHYEGIQGFATNYPVKIQLTDDEFIIQRIKPETTVTLPLNRITAFSAIGESEFMLKYHGDSAKTITGTIRKCYLVVEYDKGMLAFWGTNKDALFFQKLQNESPIAAPKTIAL